ncbi:MAG: hypothetical protein COA99_03690 [Moraxellaceae bacterium]|nr:MAG: hypothetical protein COA99_03690 [Moraxellaceae bacterium]
MSYFVGVTNANQLKFEYRRLASKHHPDKGGDSRLMQEINTYYEYVLSKIKTQEQFMAEPESPIEGDSQFALDFRGVCVGDTVYVNGTEGEVIKVNENDFWVVAKGRARQAVFMKQGGKGKYNKRLRASYDNRHKKPTRAAAA